jgi:uncharacterized protein YyaL (SSP411 family)
MTQSTSYNRLKDENSAYLKQHAQNPVHWYSYGPEALQKAKDADKPIFLSVGYSTCHWCHVMAHESFEDQTTADFLNENYVCIKVDREENPDLDHYYQQVCQAFGKRGGWPLSIFLTAEAKPFYAGTYFPKQSPNPEMPTFMDVVGQLSDAYINERDEINKSANDVIEALKTPPKIQQKVEFEGHFPHPAGIMQAISKLKDATHGGYGAAPRFPQFAFYEWAIEQMLEGMIPQEEGKHILETLEKMLFGGLYDHARGGVHRYCVDESWTVPHFEKMLYDQAGLLKTIAKATIIYPSPAFYDALMQTIEYLHHEMLSEESYFFSAQDADAEGVEGLYHCFTKDEFIEALKDFDENLLEKQDDILKWFSITEEGNFERGLNVVTLKGEHKEAIYSPEGWNTIRSVRQALMSARKMRIPPLTDNKGISSWNFMLISALADVIQYCNIEAIAQSATGLLNKTIDKILPRFLVASEEEGQNKLITSTTRESKDDLFENFVFFAESQLRLYEVTGNNTFKMNGVETLHFIFKEFFKDGSFFTRSLANNESEPYDNLHAEFFDQSYKSALATLVGLVRKWNPVLYLDEYLQSCEKVTELMTHISLTNPLHFGETLRSLSYPDMAYRKIEVPFSWITEQKIQRFFPRFSHRFCTRLPPKR